MRSSAIASAVLAAATTTIAGTIAGTAAAQPLSLAYEGSFTLPAGAFDVLPDGRLFGLSGAGEVLLETAAGSGSFVVSNTIDPVNPGGLAPSFVSRSPDGTRIAVGNNEFNANNAVLFYEPAELLLGLGIGNPVTPLETVTVPNFAGGWSDDGQTFFVSGSTGFGQPNEINRIAFDGPPGSVPAAELLVRPAGLFSGGVASAGGTLYVGDGNLGDVVAFDTASLDPTGGPATLADGSPVGRWNTAGAVDILGDLLLVAGGDVPGAGNATVIDLATGESITLQPDGTGFSFYGGFFNAATNQVIVTVPDFAAGTTDAYVYTIPAPATLAILPLAGLAAARRRR